MPAPSAAAATKPARRARSARRLSPRDVILSLREFANATLESGTVPAAAELDVHGKAPGQVAMETLWSCRTCMACVEICPVAVEHVPIIVQMRRKLVEDGAMDPLLTKTLQTIHKTGNSFGESKRKRGVVEQGAALQGQGRAQGAGRRALVRRRLRLLRPAQSESHARPSPPCCTRPASISASSTTANRTPATMCAGSARRACTRCWPSANIAALDGRVLQDHRHHRSAFLQHHPQRISRFRRQVRDPALHELRASSCSPTGKLQVTQPLKLRATFHDPCHLGRFNKGYEAPRELLKLLGCELVEMGRCRANSFCCGAGGGRIWIPDPVGAEKPAQNRIREAAAIPGLEVYVVSCPKDLTMFEDALKTTGNEGKFVVKELIELIREADSRAARPRRCSHEDPGRRQASRRAR